MRKRATTLEQKVLARDRRLAGKTRMPREMQGLIMLSALGNEVITQKSAKLLSGILKLAYRNTNKWVFDSSVSVLALTTGISNKHAKRCMDRLMQANILQPTGRSNGNGKPKEYWVQENSK